MSLPINNIIEIKGNLFDSKNSLAHCVSKDLKMGAGIAVIFKKSFGHVDELMEQTPFVGGVVSLKTGERHIFYLITKERYWHKPTYEALESSLITLSKELKEKNIKSLSIPRIGCGLDGLNWKKVKTMIEKILVDVETKVYYL